MQSKAALNTDFGCFLDINQLRWDVLKSQSCYSIFQLLIQFGMVAKYPGNVVRTDLERVADMNADDADLFS